MTGAEKRAALLALADEATDQDLGLVSAALTQIAGLDLDDPAVCAKWSRHCVIGNGRAMYRRETDLYGRAELILDGVSP